MYDHAYYVSLAVRFQEICLHTWFWKFIQAIGLTQVQGQHVPAIQT
jgi:hypothetical protein